MKKLLYSQVAGRREGETPVYKFDWWKLLIVPAVGWLTWVTIDCFKAERASEQIIVLHNRTTAAQVGQEADETRLENRLWELQLRFF